MAHLVFDVMMRNKVSSRTLCTKPLSPHAMYHEHFLYIGLATKTRDGPKIYIFFAGKQLLIFDS